MKDIKMFNSISL